MKAFSTIVAMLAGAATAHVSCVDAQAYPSKPVRFIVPYAPGGGADVMARILSPKLVEALGQQVIIDNRAGAGGNLGSEAGARAAPDGYTILMGAAALAINVSLYGKLNFDPVKDLAPPAATPAAVVTKLNADLSRIMNTPEMKEQMTQQGSIVIYGPPPQFAAYMRSEIEKWAKVVKASGAKVE